MVMRRAGTLLLASLTALLLGWLLWQVLAPGGWTVAKLVMAVAFAGTAPWTGLCLANGLIGFAILLLCRDPVRAVFPLAPSGAAPLPRTAIAVTIRDEDMRRVLPPLRRLLRALDAAGAGDAFAVFLLSDSRAATAADEAREAAAFMAEDPRVHYRRRAGNVGFKAGNLMDFLDHHAAGFDLMLTLDADSEMSAAAVLRLVRAMQADPSLAIAQHLTVGLPASSAFPRLFQFGMRAGMRTWATGQAWWQGDAGPYWGHNAAVRIAPFRAHCRLPTLPDGGHILSHDQVEAAVLRGAGWGVRVLPDEDGSWESNPPALPEFLRRELRWLAGNMQYRHLLRLPALRAMGRWQLAQAILLFAGTPLYLVFLLAAALAAATDTASPFPAGPALALTAAWLSALYAPKLLGYAEVALSPAKRARYGGAARFLGGAAAEVGFTLLLDAVSAVAKTLALLRLAFGARAEWAVQNRADRGVTWREAARLLWPQTLLGVLVFACFARAGWLAVAWALPLAGGLLAAIPLCVLTAEPWVGAWLRARRIAAIPEELAPQAAAPETPPVGLPGAAAAGGSAVTTPAAAAPW
ncbi:MAG: glucans biosynthesis glucosyltransferase MdoH [Acetobacteraceae bacterium]